MATNTTTYSTINEIIMANREIGNHFFDPSAKRFFNSRIGQAVMNGSLFITSEQFDDNTPRLYTVRQCVNGEIVDRSQFQEFTTSAAARAYARALDKSVA